MLRIELLGPLEVLRDGVAVPVGGDRARSLLAILALSAGRALTAELLVQRCWGDTAQGDPKASLHAAIRRLRVLIGPEVIRTTPHGYVFDLAPEYVDALAFARLLDPVAEAGREQICAALKLWRGEPFTGEFCDWLEHTERTRLVELWLSAVERRADLDLADGRAAAALADLQDLVAQHPLRESLWARLLLALSGCGRTAEALEQYGVIRERIADELGVEPGAELRRIFEQLLAGEPVLPERAATAAPPVPQQLPTDIADFHGRAETMAELDRVLATGPDMDRPTVLAILHGPGGAGKTSLAVHWAHRHSDEFPGGRFFVNLHGYGPGAPVEPAAALENLLTALGISAGGIPSDVDGRSALLRTALAGRRVLMVLDNARSEQQVRPLLPGSAASVLITSRSRLRGLAAREHAVQLAVDQLSVEESVELLRARIAGDDERALAELARRCSQLPLALAIAAEQVASRPESGLQEVVGDLERVIGRLDALDSGDDPASDLRAVFSWSYRALEDRPARFFRLLGLVPMPTFGIPAAAALTGVPEAAARSILRRLADLHLVNEIAPGRFQLHDLLRAYAAERVAQDEPEQSRTDALERLLDWYLQTVHASRCAFGSVSPLVDPRAAALPGTVPLRFADRDEAGRWYDAERSALTPLVEAAAERGHHERACRLAVLLWDDLYARSVTDEAMTVQALAVRSAVAAGLPDMAAAAANQLGITYGMVGRMDDALRLFTEALDGFGATGNIYGQSLAHSNLALVHGLLANSEDELHHVDLALDLARRTGIPSLISGRLNGRAMGRLRRGDHSRALADAQESLALIDTDDERKVAQIEDTIGQIHLAMGQPAQAVGYLRRAAERNLRANAPATAIGNMQRHGEALHAAGDRREARVIWRRALQIAEQHSLDDLASSARVRTGTDLMPTRQELQRLLDEPDQ